MKDTIAAACIFMVIAGLTVFVGWAFVNHTIWALAVWAGSGPVLFWYMGKEHGRVWDDDENRL